MLVGILCVLGGLLIGGVAVFLWCQQQSQSLSAELQTTSALAQQRQDDLGKQLAAEKAQTQKLRDDLSSQQLANAALAVQFQAAQQNIAEQRKLLDDANSQLRQAFASVSAEALAKNNEAFLQLARERFAVLSAEANGSLDQRKEQIDGLLKPMRQLLDQYQIRVAEIEKSRVESYSMLREQLGTLAETQRTLNTQTSQLVTALSRPTVRGQWGEISLRRLVELAGLTNRCDFIEQQNLLTEEGRLRPDMVIHLPGQRQVVIDCKTSLDAFLDAVAASDEDVRRQCLQRHAQQVRSRARQLGAKEYWSQFDHSPEFVIMFLPGEPFLATAAENDPMLIEDCLNNHVILATPSTLIALLKAIEFGWRQEDVSRNAEEIRKLGIEMYDRLAIVLGHVGGVGKSLNSAVKSYNDAVRSVETRLVVTARKMAELGAKTQKELAELPLVEGLAADVTSREPD